MNSWRILFSRRFRTHVLLRFYLQIFECVSNAHRPFINFAHQKHVNSTITNWFLWFALDKSTISCVNILWIIFRCRGVQLKSAKIWNSTELRFIEFEWIKRTAKIKFKFLFEYKARWMGLSSVLLITLASIMEWADAKRAANLYPFTSLSIWKQSFFWQE